MDHFSNVTTPDRQLPLLRLIAIVCVMNLTFFVSGSSAKDPASGGTPKAERPATPSKVESKEATSEQAAEPTKELLTGKVALLTDALKRRNIKSSDEMRGQVVLETATGELWPLISDWRGRAFFQDDRLRDRPVELVVRRHQGLPYLQILMVFTFNEQGERQYTDYWCDICSIPMYEIKDCDCCRGPIRLRFQKQDLPAYLKTTGKPKS